MFNAFIINLGSTDYTARALGSYLIATHLRHEGWDVEVVDYGLYWTLDQLKELSRSRINSNTKFIGFGHQFVTWNPVLEEYCQWIKSNYPKIVLIGGSGIIPTYYTSVIDYHIQGYGEYAISALLKYLFSNGDPIKFSPIIQGAKKIITANDFYPAFPKKSLLAEYQDRDFIDENEWLGIETSRGCIFSCDFCNFPIIGIKGDYTRDADDFEKEIRNNYDKFGVKNYNLIDETFNDSTEKITKYANVVDKLNFIPTFTGFIRADLLVARPKDREELLRMNMLGQYYGVETFNRESGKAIGKGMETNRLKEGLVDIRKYFENNNRKLYRGTLSFIVGLPGETLETLATTQQWLINHWQQQAFYAFSLQIPSHEYDQPSKFSRNYAKYGYTVMTDEEIRREQSLENYEHRQFHLDGGTTRNNLMWKNKNMNVFQSVQTAVSFEQLKSKYPFKNDCWQLSAPGYTGEVESRFKGESIENLEKNFQAKVNGYIKRKLSL